eukprot:3085458-Rhodomonas_salina.2
MDCEIKDKQPHSPHSWYRLHWNGTGKRLISQWSKKERRFYHKVEDIPAVAYARSVPDMA